MGRSARVARWGASIAVLGAIGVAPMSARADEKAACVAAVEEADTLRTKGSLKAAREDFIRCAQTSCPKVVRDDCATGLREVEAELPSVVIRATDGAGNDLADVRVEARGATLSEHLDG